MPTGMVHALGEVWRALVEDGVLIDLRPLHTGWRMEVLHADEILLVEDSFDDAPRIYKDAAADNALDEALAKGWFAREAITRIEHARGWHTVDEMVAFWGDSSPPLIFPDALLDRARHMLREAGAGAQVRVMHPLTIGVYHKQN